MWKSFFSKLKESLTSVLPVGVIVLVLALTPLVTLSGRELAAFCIATECM